MQTSRCLSLCFDEIDHSSFVHPGVSGYARALPPPSGARESKSNTIGLKQEIAWVHVLLHEIRSYASKEQGTYVSVKRGECETPAFSPNTILPICLLPNLHPSPNISAAGLVYLFKAASPVKKLPVAAQPKYLNDVRTRASLERFVQFGLCKKNVSGPT